MREILFRGKRVDNGEWIFGNILHQTVYYGDISDRWYIIEGSFNNGDGILFPVQVQKKTVGQYIGLCDMNGNRIFEGDILAEPESPKYNAGVVYYGRSNCSCCDGIYGFYTDGGADLRDASQFVIIGNIHDSPERWWE